MIEKNLKRSLSVRRYAVRNDQQSIGRSAGGLSTKIHATCDALGNPTAFHLTPGQEHDLEGADALMEQLIQADAVLADKAYDADERVRKRLRQSDCNLVNLIGDTP